MVQDTESIKDNRWKDNNEFKDFNQSVNALDESERALQNKKITLFTQYISNSIKKHFSQWIDRLLFFGIFGDQPMAKSFAKHIMSNQINNINGIHYCSFHKRSINLPKLNEWVVQEATDEGITAARSLPIIREN